MAAMHRLGLNKGGLGALGWTFRTVLGSTDLVKAGQVLTAIGTLHAASQTIEVWGRGISQWIIKLFSASITVDSNDRLYGEVMGWLSSQVFEPRGARNLAARSNSSHPFKMVDHLVEYMEELHDKDRRPTERTPIKFVPEFYNTPFRCDGSTYFLKFTGSASNNELEALKTVQIMSFGWSLTPLKKFLDICRNHARNGTDSVTTIFTADKCWRHTVSRPNRHLSTVHLEENVKQHILADMAEYLDDDTRKFYMTRGIPHRRGYLLYGPPGTGKTSLSMALAGHFNLELYLVHLPSIDSDSNLALLFYQLPPACIVLLEDVDAVGIEKRVVEVVETEDSPGKSNKAPGRGHGCTLAGLLNVLDGVASTEGRIVLMTSNHEEKLDQALKRPGRIDEKIYFGYISKPVAEKMFIGMYLPQSPSEKAAIKSAHDKAEIAQLAKQFAALIPEETYTPAELQGMLLHHQKSPQNAVAAATSWVVEQRGARREAEAQADRELAAEAEQQTAKTDGKAMAPTPSMTRSDEYDDSQYSGHTQCTNNTD